MLFPRLRAAFAAFRAAGQTPTPIPSAPQQHNSTRDVSGTAFQGRDFTGNISTGATHHADTHHHTDTHHHGTVHYGTGDISYSSPTHYGTGDQISGSVTNNNHGGNVGLQAGHVNGGILNVGGSNTFENTVIGNHIGTNNGGQIIQGGHIEGGITFGR